MYAMIDAAKNLNLFLGKNTKQSISTKTINIAVHHAILFDSILNIFLKAGFIL